jgi:hypothetical protein
MLRIAGSALVTVGSTSILRNGFAGLILRHFGEDHLNNLPNGMIVESDRLAELSTDGIVHIRKLARHEEGTCDCRATTAFLNGNNITLAAGLVPRGVRCRLDANVEYSEDRTKYDFDPMQKVRADHGKYLAAAITIIKAFQAAGAPQQKVQVAPRIFFGEPHQRLLYQFRPTFKARDLPPKTGSMNVTGTRRQSPYRQPWA